MPYLLRPLTADHGRQIARWRYPGPWSIYDVSGDLDPAEGYWAVVDESAELVGFACFGAEARVPGLDAKPGVLDVGVGMRPDLVGQGRGRTFSEAVLAHGREHAGGRRFRAAVQDWNARSVRLLESLGFAHTGTHVVPSQRKTYAILERDA